MHKTWVQSLGQEDPLEKEIATRSSILAWRIPWTEEPGGLYIVHSVTRVGHDLVLKPPPEGYGNQYWPIHSSILAWRTPPPSLTEKPGRLQSTGSQRVEHDQWDPTCIDARFFSCGSSAPVSVECEGRTAPWLAGTLAVQSVQGQTVSTPGVMALSESFFEPLVAGDQKASLASLSLLLPPLRHLEGSLAWGPSLLFGASDPLRDPAPATRGPWLGSYSVDQCIRYLKGHPGWDPTL